MPAALLIALTLAVAGSMTDGKCAVDSHSRGSGRNQRAGRRPFGTGGAGGPGCCGLGLGVGAHFRSRRAPGCSRSGSVGLRGGGRPKDRYTMPFPICTKDNIPRDYIRHRGFTKHRPKKYRNPRKHYRFKAAALAIKERSQGKKEFKGKPAKYLGEKTGIRPNAVRSKRPFEPDDIDDLERRLKNPRRFRMRKLPMIQRGDKVEKNPLKADTLKIRRLNEEKKKIEYERKTVNSSALQEVSGYVHPGELEHYYKDHLEKPLKAMKKFKAKALREGIDKELDKRRLHM